MNGGLDKQQQQQQQHFETDCCDNLQQLGQDMRLAPLILQQNESNSCGIGIEFNDESVMDAYHSKAAQLDEDELLQRENGTTSSGTAKKNQQIVGNNAGDDDDCTSIQTTIHSSLVVTPPCLLNGEMETTEKSQQAVVSSSVEEFLLKEFGPSAGNLLPRSQCQHGGLAELKVQDLKEECRKRHLSCSGTKFQIMDRLKPYAQEIFDEILRQSGVSMWEHGGFLSKFLVIAHSEHKYMGKRLRKLMIRNLLQSDGLIF